MNAGEIISILQGLPSGAEVRIAQRPPRVNLGVLGGVYSMSFDEPVMSVSFDPLAKRVLFSWYPKDEIVSLGKDA